MFRWQRLVRNGIGVTSLNESVTFNAFYLHGSLWIGIFPDACFKTALSENPVAILSHFL